MIAEARARGYARVLGMRHGVLGALRGDLVDLSSLEKDSLERLKRTPSSALGSCRYRLQPGDAERVAALCKQEEVAAFGRDILPIVRELEADLARKNGTELVPTPAAEAVAV